MLLFLEITNLYDRVQNNTCLEKYFQEASFTVDCYRDIHRESKAHLIWPHGKPANPTTAGLEGTSKTIRFPPLPWAGSPVQAARGHIQAGLEHLHGQGIHSFSEQPVQHLTALSVTKSP